MSDPDLPHADGHGPDAPGGAAALPFLPATCRILPAGPLRLAVHPEERPAHVAFLREVAQVAFGALAAALDFRPTRALTLLAYLTNDEARAHLDRPVPPTMALSPYADATRGLVVVQSVHAARENGDPGRMVRLLAHEWAHQFAWEITDSRKTLGDGNRNRNIPTWLDEGFAEVASRLALGRGDDLTAAAARAATHDVPPSPLALDRALDDLTENARAQAFDHATARVMSLVDRHGLRGLFRNLPAGATEAP